MKTTFSCDEYIEKQNAKNKTEQQKLLRKRKKLDSNMISFSLKEDILFSKYQSEVIHNGIFNENVNSDNLREDSDWDPSDYGFSQKRKKHNR